MKLLTTPHFNYYPNCCHMHHVPGVDKQCLPGLVYVARFGDIFKIGKTTKSIERRMDDLKKHIGIRPEPVIALSTICCTSLEIDLHRRFRSKGIWAFRVQVSEYFWLDSQDLRYIAAVRWNAGAPVSLLYVSEAVGHSSIATTGLYAHPTKGRDLASKLKAM